VLSGDAVAGVHPERVVPGAFADRGLVLTGTIVAFRPAGAGWEADLRVGEETITCRLLEKAPSPGADFTVTVLAPRTSAPTVMPYEPPGSRERN
jgi:hypothetical protein